MNKSSNSAFNPLDLRERKILVTGASSGIGRASAVYLSKLGARIVVSGRNIERLDDTIKMLEGEGHLSVPCDLAAEEDLSEMFRLATPDGTKLSGLVHCAGVPWVMPLRVLSRKQITSVMENNFYPFIELTRQYSKSKYSDGGSIVALSSILAVSPRGGETGYIASKAAMDAAVQSLAFELAPKKIRINGIYCGNIMTEMTRRTLDAFENQEHFQKVVDQSLLGLGQPEDIASVVAFLISDMSRFITGRMIYADGGVL